MSVLSKKLGAMVGIGDSVRQINKILPEYTSALMDVVLGYEFGIAENYEDKFDYELVTNGLRIKVGSCWAYGYGGYSLSDTVFTFTMPSSVSRYVFIYGEFDLSGSAVDGATVEAFNIVAYDNGAVSSYTYTQDNLQKVKNGKFQVPLYRVELKASGILSTNQIADYRNIYNRVRAAENAEKALNVSKVVEGTAVIRSGASIENGVTVPTRAVNDSSTNLANTAFVARAITNVKNINGASVAVGGVAAGAHVKRQVNFVYGQISCEPIINSTYFASGKTVGTIPYGYRPKQSFYTYSLLRQDAEAYGVLKLEIQLTGDIIATDDRFFSGIVFNTSATFTANFGYEITES